MGSVIGQLQPTFDRLISIWSKPLLLGMGHKTGIVCGSNYQRLNIVMEEVSIFSRVLVGCYKIDITISYGWFFLA